MISRTLPTLTLTLASLIAVLPFGGGDAMRLCLSFAPVVVTHYWTVRRPRLLPSPLVFAFGLMIDVLTHGPLGYWAFLMLAAAALAPLEEAATGQSTAVGRAAVFAMTMLLVAGLAWGIASLYSGMLVDAQPMLFAALASVLTYPLVAMVLMPIDRIWTTPRSHLFERGGA